MSEQLTKQQIQEEYSKSIGLLGDRLYKCSLPFLDICEILKHLLSLNRQMTKILQKESEEEKK